MNNNKFEKVDKKYSLYNSYFKNRKETYPDTILQVAQYEQKYNELPFVYLGENWVYDAMIERQKRRGVIGNQFLTPDSVAEQVAALTDNFNPKDRKVMNACCGIGQLVKYLLGKGFNVEGFDGDSELVETCKILYPNANFFQMDFRNVESDKRWDLIVANPPHETSSLRQFMEWLSSAMSVDGKAILILPAGYMKKERPSGLVKILKRFHPVHNEAITEVIPFTSTKHEISIIELSQEYKDLYNHDSKNHIDKTQEEYTVQKLKIMEANEKEKTYLVPLTLIKPNPDNPRKKITEGQIEELAVSIKQSGLLQSVILRRKDNHYEIVCGERRCLAFIKNGELTIPAYIRELTDEQVVEMALVENLQRESLTPMEESNAFQKLVETGKYTLEDLMAKFGKTETFIRSRLRLQNLTDDFKAILDNDEITLAVALEISKYDLKMQEVIFNRHFRNDDNTSWREIGAKEMAGRIERAYTTDLSKYNFDKTECNKCRCNTGTFNLFSDPSGGRCTNRECLDWKKTQFTISLCDAVAEKYNSVDVCIAPYDKIEEKMQTELEQKGIQVKTVLTQNFPDQPLAPARENFKTETAYQQALDEHKISVLAYNQEMDELEEKAEKGEIKKVVYIGDNNPKLCYVPVATDPQKDPIKALQEEDEANMRLAKTGVIKELTQLLKTCVLTPSAFSEFEEQVIFFYMLDSLNINHYILFGIKETNLKCLPDDMKYKICKSLTPVQKALIQRDFLIRNLIKGNESNAAMTLLIAFARQHFPQETEDISRKFTDSYNKKHQKIKKQMDSLNKSSKRLETSASI